MGLCMGQIKTGSLTREVEGFYINNLTLRLFTYHINIVTPCKGETTIKDNQLLIIDKKLVT